MEKVYLILLGALPPRWVLGGEKVLPVFNGQAVSSEKPCLFTEVSLPIAGNRPQLCPTNNQMSDSGERTVQLDLTSQQISILLRAELSMPLCLPPSLIFQLNAFQLWVPVQSLTLVRQPLWVLVLAESEVSPAPRPLHSRLAMFGRRPFGTRVASGWLPGWP